MLRITNSSQGCYCCWLLDYFAAVTDAAAYHGPSQLPAKCNRLQQCAMLLAQALGSPGIVAAQ
jgi:hypothetical protein